MKVCVSLLVVLSTIGIGSAFVTPLLQQKAVGRTRSTDSSLFESTGSREGSIQSTSPADSETYDLLGLPARPGRPLKIAIAGGGVGGLTAALCMLKKGFDVTVYEKTSAFARFGGPIQFASNALSVLKEIDDVLFERVMDKFTFTGIRTCGITLFPCHIPYPFSQKKTMKNSYSS